MCCTRHSTPEFLMTRNAKIAPEALANDSKKERSLLARLLRNRSGRVGFILIAFFVVISVLGILEITPYPILEQHPRDRLQAPSATYLLGTDQFGRDLASRIMKGGANSLQVAVLSVALSTLVGTVLGMTSGYVGGTTDTVIMRLMDVLFAFPSLLLALLVVTVLGPGLNNTVLAIATVYTPIFARVARGPVLALKEMEFVMAARCLGLREWRILFLHVFPNMRAPMIVQVTLALSVVR